MYGHGSGDLTPFDIQRWTEDKTRRNNSKVGNEGFTTADVPIKMRYSRIGVSKRTMIAGRLQIKIEETTALPGLIVIESFT